LLGRCANVEPGAKRKVRRTKQTKPTAAVSLVAQNITAATREDLAAFRRELEPRLRPRRPDQPQKAQNRDVREQIGKALDAGARHGQGLPRRRSATRRSSTISPASSSSTR